MTFKWQYIFEKLSLLNFILLLLLFISIYERNSIFQIDIFHLNKNDCIITIIELNLIVISKIVYSS